MARPNLMDTDVVVPNALRSAFEFVDPDRCDGTLHDVRGLDYAIPLQRYEAEGPQAIVVDVARHVHRDCRSCRYMLVTTSRVCSNAVRMKVECDLKRPNTFGVVCPAEALAAAKKREKGSTDKPTPVEGIEIGSW